MNRETSSREIIVAASVLSADFSNLEREIRRIEGAGADWLHLDVMDGHFVPNISFGPPVVSAIRRCTKLPLEVHLMVTAPGRLLETFAAIGVQRMIVHCESGDKIGDTLQRISSFGCQRGLAINPETALAEAEPYFDEIEELLIMTVSPGFGGQSFRPEVVGKIEATYSRRAASGLSFRIAVDGGIKPKTSNTVVAAGADLLVSGSALIEANDMRSVIREMRMVTTRDGLNSEHGNLS